MTDILTTTLPTGETVLAKTEVDPFSKFGGKILAPLRYGNESAAQKKLNSTLPLLSPARSAGIVKQEGRFLIFIYDNPGYQTLFSEIVHRDLDSRFKHPSIKALQKVEADMDYRGPRDHFATTTGMRMNPRSRHNHPHNTTDERYYYVL